MSDDFNDMINQSNNIKISNGEPIVYGGSFTDLQAEANLIDLYKTYEDRANEVIALKAERDALRAENESLKNGWLNEMNLVIQRNKDLEAKLAIATEALADIISCFKDDDWRCDRCDKDPEMETCNAAYIAREALEKLK
jgi:hypothetical protein